MKRLCLLALFVGDRAELEVGVFEHAENGARRGGQLDDLLDVLLGLGVVGQALQEGQR